ncbi:hypothetical protein F5887DRAFT_1019499 [Amanita rubescens]|nr:hypothetical protein F5887DRAFT_1019499 [Amanita rubescens]
MLPTSPGGEIVWEGRGRKLGSENVEDKDDKCGMILPQVILRGTVTYRAIEKTSKVNCFQRGEEQLQVGTESSSLCTTRLHDRRCVDLGLGDAQFGMHNATASGRMILEGTKSAGTDLHSKDTQPLIQANAMM